MKNLWKIGGIFFCFIFAVALIETVILMITNQSLKAKLDESQEKISVFQNQIETLNSELKENFKKKFHNWR